MAENPPVILIAGPTAGGKTALSIALARSIPGGGECICADSIQVYRDMDIGTAKPTAEEQAAARHHLLDLIDPSEEGFSVDVWLELCEQAIADITSRGHVPIIVGGTNFYIKAFLHGLSPGPEPNPQLRAELEQMSDEAMRQRLEAVDPDSARRIHPNDRKRTIRAIEVYEASGQPISDLQGQWDRSSECFQPRENVFIVGLEYPAAAINRRINARVKAMVEQGFIEEVSRLHEADRLGLQAKQALGYRQMLDYLEGRISQEEAIEQIKIRTRRYGKNQRTWLKQFRLHEPSVWLDAAEATTQELIDQAFTAIQPWLAQQRQSLSNRASHR